MPSIYDKASALDLSCIYLYYVNSRDFKKSRVYCYWKSFGSIENLRDRIKYMIENAYQHGNDPPACAQYLSDIKMRRKSLLVIVVEDKLLHRQKPINIIKNSGDGDSSHTFSNAKYDQITTRIGDHDVSFEMAVVVNSMRSKRYNDDLHENEHEVFRFIIYDVDGNNVFPSSPHYVGTRAVTPAEIQHEHESGGTNMGPPVPPP